MYSERYKEPISLHCASFLEPKSLTPLSTGRSRIASGIEFKITMILEIKSPENILLYRRSEWLMFVRTLSCLLYPSLKMRAYPG